MKDILRNSKVIKLGSSRLGYSIISILWAVKGMPSELVIYDNVADFCVMLQI